MEILLDIYIPFHILQFEIINESHIVALCDEPNCPRIVYLNINTQTIVKGFGVFDEMNDIEIPRSFANNGSGQINLIVPANDTIFLLVNIELISKYKINFGSCSLNSRFFDIKEYNLKKNYISKHNMCMLTHIFSSNDNLFVYYLQNDELVGALIKKGKTMIQTKGFSFNGEEIGLPVAYYHNMLVFIIDSKFIFANNCFCYE